MWIAEISACDECQGYDGNVYNLSDTNAPRVPAHPFCKCAEVAHIDRQAFEADLTRRGL